MREDERGRGAVRQLPIHQDPSNGPMASDSQRLLALLAQVTLINGEWALVSVRTNSPSAGLEAAYSAGIGVESSSAVGDPLIAGSKSVTLKVSAGLPDTDSAAGNGGRGRPVGCAAAGVIDVEHPPRCAFLGVSNAATDIPVTGEAATLDADRCSREVLLREES